MSLQFQLSTLEASGLIRLEQVEPELEYLFRHALIQDAAYESLLKADRRVLHRAVAETLERLYPEQKPELASTLGHHYSAAGEIERARHYLTLAGNHALAQYANAEAEKHYRAALSFTVLEADKAQVLSGLGMALNYQGRFGAAVQTWRQAIILAQEVEDYAGVARLYALSARALWESGDNPGSLALCREGLAAVEGHLETAALAFLLHETARACYFNGRPAEMRAFGDRALKLAERLGDVETQAEALITLTFDEPNYETVVDELTRALQLAETAGLLSTAARAHYNLGEILRRLGDFRQAGNHFRSALELARRLGSMAEEIFFLSAIAANELLLGNFASVDQKLEEIQQLYALVNDPSLARRYLRIAAQLLHYRGEWEAAAHALQAVQSEMLRYGNLELQARANVHLADLLLELGKVVEAESLIVETMDLEKRIGERGAWPGCLLAIACARQGRLDAARRSLWEARELADPNDESRLAQAEAYLAMAESRWPEALAAFEKASTLLAKIGWRWFRARTLRDWAEAHLTRNEPGDVGRARELLQEALREFEALSVPGYAALTRERLQVLL